MTSFAGLSDFFARHFPALGADERIEIRAFPQGGGQVQRSWHATPEAAAQEALNLPQHLNIFFGIQARRDRGGKKADVTMVRALWADMDFKHYADGRDGALQAVRDFPLPPTVVVDSGNGFHLYWYLAAPVEPCTAIEQLLGDFYARLGGLDAVQDLSRVLRVPETFNNKTTPAKLARVRHAEYEAVYALADFEALLPAPVEPERVAWSPPAPGGGRPAYDDVPSIAELREIMRHIPPTGDYTGDWLRHLAAVQSVYPGPEGVAICEEWSPGKPGEIARKFASFKRDGRAADATSVATLIYTAKQNGYQPPRRQHAPSPVATPKPIAMEAPADTLDMAQALDTALRQVADLEAQLARCQEAHERKDRTIETLRIELQAYKAALSFPDSTMGGSVFDVAYGAFDERKRGEVLVEDGKEKARVCYQTAANLRSSSTVGKAAKRFVESGVVDGTFRKIHIDTPAFKGDIEACYIEIPPQCDTPVKYALHLLSNPPEKKHGGARRKRELPDLGEPVEGPIQIVTEQRNIYSSVATEKVLEVEKVASRTEYCDEEGYQLTAAEVDTFRESIGLKPKEPAYRPQPAQQLPLSPEDIALTTMPHFDLAVDPRRPVPLYGACAQPGCALPAMKDHALCSRHNAMHSYSMAGAD